MAVNAQLGKYFLNGGFVILLFMLGIACKGDSHPHCI